MGLPLLFTSQPCHPTLLSILFFTTTKNTNSLEQGVVPNAIRDCRRQQKLSERTSVFPFTVGKPTVPPNVESFANETQPGCHLSACPTVLVQPLNQAPKIRFSYFSPTQINLPRVRIKIRPSAIAGVPRIESPISFLARIFCSGPSSRTTILPFSPAT
ncbi:hypothetical protein Enr17x_22990 [Gimesia fumaroli]|uniref:Uncharacterized protein n=1 Tax=Gimesia fumaroli TaxID=2527976 RepID=A0A518IAX5_9PLAN|nr:hypothetical protein Enr17x_22990 [Gimesia fumaroli]